MQRLVQKHYLVFMLALCWNLVRGVCVCSQQQAGEGSRHAGWEHTRLHFSHLQPREELIKSGSPSLADEFFIKTICSPRAPTKISPESPVIWVLVISVRWSFTAKSSLCSAHFSFVAIACSWLIFFQGVMKYRRHPWWNPGGATRIETTILLVLSSACSWLLCVTVYGQLTVR